MIIDEISNYNPNYTELEIQQVYKFEIMFAMFFFSVLLRIFMNLVWRSFETIGSNAENSYSEGY
jgi:hypothetical protein